MKGNEYYTIPDFKMNIDNKNIISGGKIDE
jgi:hypothetical protein